MKFSTKKYPLLRAVKERANTPFVPYLEWGSVLLKIIRNKAAYDEFWGLIINEIYSGRGKIEYISEPVRKLVDDNVKMAQRLNEARHVLPSCSGIFLMCPQQKGRRDLGMAYAYLFMRDEKRRVVFFTVMQTCGNIITGLEAGHFPLDEFPHIYLAQDISFNRITADFTTKSEGYKDGYIMQMALELAVFKEVAKLETKTVDGSTGKQKKARLNGAKFYNEVALPITVLDSNYYTRSIREEGFTVTAHPRMQPYGPGRSKLKLIIIDEFEKHGYTKRAKIEGQPI